MSYDDKNINTLPAPLSIHSFLNTNTKTQAAFFHADSFQRATLRVSPLIVNTLLGLPLVLDGRTAEHIREWNKRVLPSSRNSEDSGLLGQAVIRYLNDRVFFPRRLCKYTQSSHPLPHYSYSIERDVCVVLCSGDHASHSVVGVTREHTCVASEAEDSIAPFVSNPYARVIWMTRQVKLMLVVYLLFDPAVSTAITSLAARQARGHAYRLPVSLWPWVDVFVERPVWASHSITLSTLHTLRVYTPYVELKRLSHLPFVFSSSPPSADKTSTLLLLFVTMCCHDAANRIYTDLARHAATRFDEGADVYFGLVHLLFHSVLSQDKGYPSLESIRAFAATDSRKLIQHAARDQLQSYANAIIDYLCETDLTTPHAFMLFETIPTNDALILLASLDIKPPERHQTLMPYTSTQLHPSQVESEVCHHRFDLVSIHVMRKMARSWSASVHGCGFPASLSNPLSPEYLTRRTHELSITDPVYLFRVEGPAPWYAKHSLEAFFASWLPQLELFYTKPCVQAIQHFVVAPLSDDSSVVCMLRDAWEFFSCMQSATAIRSLFTSGVVTLGHVNLTNLLLFHCVAHNPATPTDQQGAVQLHCVWRLISIVAELTGVTLGVGDAENVKTVHSILMTFAHKKWILPLHCLKVLIHLTARWRVAGGQTQNAVETQTQQIYDLLMENPRSACIAPNINSIRRRTHDNIKAGDELYHHGSVVGSDQATDSDVVIEEHTVFLNCLATFCTPTAPDSYHAVVIGVLQRLDVVLDVHTDLYERLLINTTNDPLNDWWPYRSTSETTLVVTEPPPTDEKDATTERQLYSAIWLIMYFCGFATSGDQVFLNRSRLFASSERKRDDRLDGGVDLQPYMDVLKTRCSYPCIGHRCSDNGRVSLSDVAFLPLYVNTGDGVSSLQRWFLTSATPPSALLTPFTARVNFLYQRERSKMTPGCLDLNSPFLSPSRTSSIRKASTDDDSDDDDDDDSNTAGGVLVKKVKA